MTDGPRPRLAPYGHLGEAGRRITQTGEAARAFAALTDLPARWYIPSEVAKLFRVDPKTICRWEAEGRFARYGIRVVRTLGGHRRFDADAIDKHLEGKA